jgi:hypothetical protein
MMKLKKKLITKIKEIKNKDKENTLQIQSVSKS